MGGSARSGQQRGMRRGYDLETQIEVTLEEVAKGAKKEIDFTRQDLCTTCNGNGAKPGSKPVTCVACGGQGQVAQTGFGGMFRMVTTCPSCGGQGKVYREKCSDCKGSGRMPKHRVLVVPIPAGIREGQAIRISGEGEPGQGGGPRGDLHVVIHVAAHQVFERDGDDLVLKMPISFAQAALGASVKVPTLEDEQTVTIKPGTQHGATIRIPGKGLPNLRGGRAGDLVVILGIEVPTRLSDKQERLLRDYAATENRDVMPESHGFWEKIKQYLS
jgi:molecular chaperone DnaJ